MRRIVFAALMVTVFFSACNRKQAATGGEKTSQETQMTADTGHARIRFSEFQHDFGTMEEGEIVSYVFEFTNTGTAPLLITSASASCGCTVPRYPKKPIPPGKKGELEVEFNSRGKTGRQHKTIAVRANTRPPVTLLVITADVKEKKK